MTIEKELEAKKWLVDNKDKWENDIEFKFLVPLNEVPEVVVEWAKEYQEREEEIGRQFAMKKKMLK